MQADSVIVFSMLNVGQKQLLKKGALLFVRIGH